MSSTNDYIHFLGIPSKNVLYLVSYARLLGTNMTDDMLKNKSLIARIKGGARLFRQQGSELAPIYPFVTTCVPYSRLTVLAFCKTMTLRS